MADEMRPTGAEKHDAALAAVEKMWGGGDQAEAVATQTEETVDADPQEAQQPEQAETPQEQPEETEEVEIDGEIYAIPKKISDRFKMHADYTRKTQETAEMRRALSAEREAMALDRAFQESIAEESKKLTLLDAQIGQFKNIDWTAIEDAGQMMRLRAQLDQLKDQRKELADSLQAKRGDFEKQVKAKAQEAIQAGQKYVEQHVKGFNDSMKQGLFAYGLNEGYTRDELDRIVDPRIIVTLWKASQWDALQSQKPAVTKKAAQAAPVIKPGATKPTPPKSAQLLQGIKQAKGNQAKVRAAEDYFAERLSR
jgi:hypothetical protein